MIYFLGNKEQNILKIGFSSSKITNRLKQIQTTCPYELRLFLLLRGSQDKEFILHKFLKTEHIRGEWFKFDGVEKNLKINLESIKNRSVFNWELIDFDNGYGKLKLYDEPLFNNLLQEEESKNNGSLNVVKNNTEKDLVVNAIKNSKNKTEAANILGIHRTHLYKKMYKYDIAV